MDIDRRPYVRHRARFLETLRERGAAAVVFTGTTKARNHDSEYRFRPDSDFFWLTGFEEPDAVLVLLPGRDAGESVLFLRERVPAEELWTGRRLGVGAAREVLGVDDARPIERFWDDLPGLLAGHARVVHKSGLDADRDRRLLQIGHHLRLSSRGGVEAPREWLEPLDSLHELRLVKDADELARLARAAEISVEAHLACMATAAPGINECELDGLLEYTFRRRGATGAAYTNIVAGGANACVLHYQENDRPLRAGELLLVDAGAEYEFHASDVTRTFPISGAFTPAQRALYDIVLDAQRAAIAATKPGATLAGVHDVATRVLAEGLIALGLLDGPLDACLESRAYRRYAPHGTGHWLGLDVHDCGAYHVGGAPRPLVPGMVTTVEPGLYVAPDDERAPAEFRGLGIRIEDDVVVTATGCDVLTDALPKTIDAIEAACNGERVAAVT